MSKYTAEQVVAEARRCEDGRYYQSADMLNDYATLLREREPVKCVGCEGMPSSENSPCEVCGREAAVVKAGDASCIWSQDGDDSDTWTTGCRNVFLINDGTPTENYMRFCCYCGKPVDQHLCANEDGHHD